MLRQTQQRLTRASPGANGGPNSGGAIGEMPLSPTARFSTTQGCGTVTLLVSSPFEHDRSSVEDSAGHAPRSLIALDDGVAPVSPFLIFPGVCAKRSQIDSPFPSSFHAPSIW